MSFEGHEGEKMNAAFLLSFKLGVLNYKPVLDVHKNSKENASETLHLHTKLKEDQV